MLCIYMKSSYVYSLCCHPKSGSSEEVKAGREGKCGVCLLSVSL